MNKRATVLLADGHVVNICHVADIDRTEAIRIYVVPILLWARVIYVFSTRYVSLLEMLCKKTLT